MEQTLVAPFREISQPMSPAERIKIQALKNLKHFIENTDETFSLYKKGKELGIPPSELSTMLKMRLILKRSSENHLKFLYSWNTGEPTRQMHKEIYEKTRTYHNEACRQSNLKKKKALRRKQEEERALREAAAKKIKQAKLQSIKSQGRILDESNHDLVNTLKASSEGYSKEDLGRMLSHYKEKTIPDKNQEIPITVQVTTSGNRKTININISI